MKPVYIPESTPGIPELHMENDLLAHENRLLRAKLEESSQPETAAEQTATERGQHSLDEERFRQAYYDLRWFVQRLNGSPLGFALRRWRGFRILVDRYGRLAQ